MMVAKDNPIEDLIETNAELFPGKHCIPVVYSKAKDSFGFLVWIDRDGKALDVDSFSEWKCTAKDASFTAKLKKVDFDEMAALEGQLPFVIERSELPSALTGVQYNYLPTGEGETVTLSAKKWTVAKPAVVKYKKGVGFDQAAFEKGVAQGKTNLSGLKLTYTSREGTFKGSFTVYTITGKDTLKKVTATVEGAVVGNAGYGSALIKKVGSMPVVIGTSEEDED